MFQSSLEQGCGTQQFPINVSCCQCSNPNKTPLEQQEVLVSRAAAGSRCVPVPQVVEQCCHLSPAMRLPVLCALVTLLSLSRCRAVSFPEDEDPINVVDYHCKSSAEHQGKSSKVDYLSLAHPPQEIKKKNWFLSNWNVFTGFVSLIEHLIIFLKKQSEIQQ